MGFCDSSQGQQNQTGWSDPLGPTSFNGSQPVFSATGAPQMRSQLFNYLGGYLPTTTQSGANYASALTSAASNPTWNTLQANAGKTAAGNYLAGSPQLDTAMANNRAATMASSANDNARIRSEFAKNGIGFSTANQQAEQANTAAAGATAQNTNAQTYLQNYLSERQNQQNAGNTLAQAQGTPLNYMSGISSAYTTPLSQAGNLLSALSSGGQVFSTGTTGSYSPSTGSSILNGIGAL